VHRSTNTLTPSQVYRFAIGFCEPHLAFGLVGKVTAEVLLTVLFDAAARISSISETCRRLDAAPHEETFANAPYANLFSLEEIKRRVNACFTAHLRRESRSFQSMPIL
jgi:hypothetical protein